jgi:hypothetical protein
MIHTFLSCSDAFARHSLVSHRDDDSPDGHKHFQEVQLVSYAKTNVKVYSAPKLVPPRLERKRRKKTENDFM